MKTPTLLAASLAFASAACGPFHLGSRDQATVIFSNETLNQASVYAMESTQPIRIGTVLALHTDTLRIPSSVIRANGGQTNIVARILTQSYQPSTGPITLAVDDVIRVRLSSDGRSMFVTPP